MTSVWEDCEITSDLKQSVVEIAKVIKRCPKIGVEEVIEVYESAEKEVRKRIRKSCRAYLQQRHEFNQQGNAVREQLESTQIEHKFLLGELLSCQTFLYPAVMPSNDNWQVSLYVINRIYHINITKRK
jgi:hypothetical protein